MNRFICCAFVLTLACPAPTAAADYDIPFTVPYQSEVTVGPDGLVVSFTELVGDSRCPIGIWCFWEGDAEVVISVAHPSLGVHQLTLHTYYDFVQEACVGLWSVALREVMPYPVFGDPPVPPEDYQVELLVTLLPPVETDVVPWGAVKSLYR